jgi:hypothetical protein
VFLSEVPGDSVAGGLESEFTMDAEYSSLGGVKVQAKLFKSLI